jgi:squalene-hopene/tetraprenyl-beta-curcumene cyclase
MREFLAAVFLLLAVSAGALFGWALSNLYPGRRRHLRRLLIRLGAGMLAAGAALIVYFFGLRAGDAPASLVDATSLPWNRFQFQLENTNVPRAWSDEPIRKSVSFPAALSYLDQGADVWNRKFKCIGCHANASYLLFRPALSEVAGVPSSATRDFVVANLEPYVGKKQEIMLQTGNRPAQVVWAAAGLANWDLYVSHVLSPETDATLRCMFRLQQRNAEWITPLCWPPLQSDGYQLATVAALAAGTAPGWLATAAKDPDLQARIDLLRAHLRDAPPPHDYARVWLLWASLRFLGILAPDSGAAIVDLIWKRQHEDGGWALRDFAQPGQWGDGTRRRTLEAEPDFGHPASDAHMTGFAVCVLRDAGVPAADHRIQKAVGWLLTHQRESGRWWARSLNGDTYHYLTYSATCFALTALWKCSQFPAQPVAAGAVARPRG